jgi:type IV pilus assembly protein PilY1
LLVGSNNGFFHGFDARTGAELFAYMPSELLLPRAPNTHAQINELMRPDYSHRYFVDGSAALGDAYIGSSWRTMVVGTMGAGGRTVFALDVTNPAAVGTASVRWEFTHPDLGFGVTKPRIIRMSDGTWAAVFGNGVNSATHRPRLFVVNLANGSLIHNIALGGAGDGSAADPNGLSPGRWNPPRLPIPHDVRHPRWSRIGRRTSCCGSWPTRSPTRWTIASP